MVNPTRKLRSLCKTCNCYKSLKSEINCNKCRNHGKMCTCCKRCILSHRSIDTKCPSCFKKCQNKSLNFNDIFNVLNIHNTKKGDINFIYRYHNSKIKKFITFNKLEKRGVKIVTCTSILFSKIRDSGKIYQTAHFLTNPLIFLPNNDSNIIDYIIPTILSKMESFTTNGSFWRYEKIKLIRVDAIAYKPLS